MGPLQVLDFWFALGEGKWWAKDLGLDLEIHRLFGDMQEAATFGDLDHWEETADGALALIILIDQFSRNIYRDTPRAFLGDDKACVIAQRAIAKGFDKRFSLPERRFMYLPFMHAEDLVLQERCVDLCRAAGDAEGLKSAEIHADIIRRFGRFPHRNRILGRDMRPEERAFLDAGGFSG